MKRNKIYTQPVKRTRKARVTSVIIAAVIILNNLPLNELNGVFSPFGNVFGWFRNKTSISVSAEDVTTEDEDIAEIDKDINDISEELATKFKMFNATDEAGFTEWVEASNTYNINSAEDLSRYSSAYRYDEIHNSESDVGHSKDTLIINFGSDGSPMEVRTDPFYSIGQVKPFRGKIKLANSLNYINIDKALFDQIGEETVIMNEAENAAKELVISRSAPSSDPIFAKKVVKALPDATTSGTTLGWVIQTKTFLDTGNPINSDVAGLIGEIDGDAEGGASVKISLNDERCMNVSSSTDVGYICGIMHQNSRLEIGSITTANDGNDKVTVTASGNGSDAGAIVGSMESGASLVLPATMESFPVSSVTANGDNSYAGGIVGYNVGGSVSFSVVREGSKYTVDQTISGKTGSGGLFGYYLPALTEGSASLSYDDYLINCSLNGKGSSGGLFGVLYNNGNITITDGTGNTDHIIVNNSGGVTSFGGLIGSYLAVDLTNTLTLTNCYSKPSQSGSSTNYGGAIGKIDGKAYVKINSFTTSSSDANNFGGIVGSAEAAFVDVNASTVTVTSFANNAAVNCGGLINKLGNGVLRLNGTIDLTSAKTTGGQIVNTRDCGFVFAEPSTSDSTSFKLKRSGAEADDIGSWGEVIRFRSSGFTKDSVITHSDGDHYVTLLGSVASMSSASDFARTALNIQHNTGAINDATAVLRFTSGSGTADTLLGTANTNGTNLSLGDSFSLSGTGIQGLTRDDGSQTYKGATFNGNGKILTLAIGEAYGERNGSSLTNDDDGSGKIYKHTNVGLFGKTNGATIQNVTLAGNIYVGSAAAQCVGAAAAENAGGFTAYGVTVSSAMHHSGGEQLLMGGLLGKSSNGNITIGADNIPASGSTPEVIKACTLTMDVSGNNSNNSTCIGGAVGYINSEDFTVAIRNVTVSGTIQNSSSKQRQEIGGLIAFIEAGTGTRTLSLDSVNINGLTVEGSIIQEKKDNAFLKKPLSIGGLLGYAWYDTAVSFNSVTVSGTPVIRADVGNLNGIDVDMAGLVYAGSGSWTVGTVTIPAISVVTYSGENATTNVRSFGMIVNRSFKDAKGNALYLVLPDMSTYKLGTYTGTSLTTALSKASNFGGFNDNTVFDELVAYSAFYEEDSNGVRTSKVLENGQGIVSIRTRGNTSTVNNVMKTNTCNTYQNQVTGVNMGNPNTRYYYDLDLLLSKVDTYKAQKAAFDNDYAAYESQMETYRTNLADYNEYLAAVSIYETKLAEYNAAKAEYEAQHEGETYPESAPTAPEVVTNPTIPTPPAVPTALSSGGALMLWSLNQYAHSSLTGTDKPFNYNPFSNNEIAPNGNESFDMDGFSYYPVNVSGAKIKGTFKLHNQDIQNGEAASPTPTDGYARTTLNESDSNFTTTPYTQHHLMQNGIFLNANGAIVVNGVLTLQGTIGADTYSDNGSGALICGTLNGYLNSDGTPVTASLSSADIKITDGEGTVTSTIDCEIVLDGIKVHNIGNRSSTTYAPLLVNRIDSYTDVTLEDVYVKNSSSYGTSGDVAASSLIGDAGTSTSSCNINLTFSAIKLDGRKQAISNTTFDSNMTAAYGTSLSIFTKATLLNKYQYYTGSSGKYNYMCSEDWGTDSSGNRFVTYGKEVGHDAGEGEWGNKEQRYLAEAGSSDNPFFTHPDEKPTASSTKFGEFNRFLPYVATEYDGNTKHELKVNHGKTSISGCGTYNDPYLITDGEQLATIAEIIAGNHDDAKVCMPNNEGDFTEKWHSTGGHQLYVYNKNNDSRYARDDNGVKNIPKEAVVQYLCSAYYKINEDIELPSDFLGLGCTTNAKQAFRGVIVGNNNPTITNNSPNPLILNSNGSVVKDLTIKVSNSNITTDDVAPSTAFNVNTNREAYGAVIGKIHGGDNIIDNVGVTFDTGTTIIPASKRTPVGGYVGVEIAGALIFRNMTTNKNGLTSTQCSAVSDDNYLYVNPIIGRVINAYAVTESSAYIPFEDTTRSGYTGTTVTMKNGTKNYSITDIAKETTINGVTSAFPMLQIGTYNAVSGASSTTNKTTITFPNAQSVFILSCLIQDGITTNNANSYGNGNTNIKSYNENNKTTHVSQYRGIGLTKKVNGEDVIITDKTEYGTTNAQAKADYDLAITDSYVIVKLNGTQTNNRTVIPYVVANYVDSTNREGVFRLTHTNSVCDIGFSGIAGTWYLPDGFRGLGSVGFGSSDTDIKNMTLSVNKVSGLIESNVVNLDLNMNLKHYDYEFENYKPYGKAGFGLFNTIRHNRTDQTPSANVPLSLEDRSDEDYKIMYLDISGKINYDVVHNTGSMEYNRTNVLGGSSIDANYLHVGGFAGYSGFGGNENLNVEHIGIDGLEVNGFKSSGGIFGYLYMNNSDNHLATISNIITNDLTVTTKLYAGGILGYADQIGLTIDEIKISNPTILTYYVGDNYENGTAGIAGCVKNNTKNRPITISNITIGDLDTVINSRIGYPSTFIPTNSNDYLRIAAAGIVGESNTNSTTYMTNNNKPYSMIIKRCHVYNIDFYGNRVAGILGHYGGTGDNAGSSSFSITDVEVKSNNNAIIQGLTFSYNHKSRGCGGVVGYVKLASGRKANLDNCTVDNYTLASFNDTAGLCSNFQNNGSLIVSNIKLKDLKLHSNYAGGLFAYLDTNTTGFNIQMDNLQFKKYDATQSYLHDSNAPDKYGYLVGRRPNGKYLKLVGLYRQNDPPDSENGYDVPDKLIGHGTLEDSDGYVIFSDYQGTSATEQKNDWSVHNYNLPTVDPDTGAISNVAMTKLNEYNTFSPVNQYNVTSPQTGFSNVSISSQDFVTLPKTVDANGVTRFITDKDGKTITYKDYYNINQNFPFVTSSPSVNIGIDSVGTDENGSSRNHMQFLTGDGISNLDYDHSAAHAILTDCNASTKPKNYYNQVTLSSAYPTNSTNTDSSYIQLDKLLNSKMSTFKDVTATQYPNGLKNQNIDFPVLILDDADGTRLTNMLNSYLQTLTNTKYTFSANNDSSIYNLRIAKCVYNSSTNKFDVTCKDNLEVTSATDGINLYTRNGNFTFDVNNVDSGKVQFTLIDVEFYDPSTSGNNRKVAYHLYVPVYVSQMLKFDFQISSKSGSIYKLDQYTGDRGNNTLENIGTPITVEARYIYQRGLDDWKQAANNGENLLRDLTKTWDIIDHTENGFPANTKMVLVDPNQGNKAYYSTLTSDQVYGTNKVTDQTDAGQTVSKVYLNRFIDSDNQTFKAKTYNDYLVITMKTASDGKFIAASESEATIKAKLGETESFFKPKPSNYSGSDTYDIDTVEYTTDAKTYTNASLGTKKYLMEDYYLTIFTEKTGGSDEKTLNHYQFIAPNDLSDSVYPSRYTRLTGGTAKQSTHIIVGDLFYFKDAKLTTLIEEGSNGSYSAKSSNDVDIASAITVDVENTLCMTEVMFNNKSFLSNSSVHIYETLLLSMNKQTDASHTHRGIEAKPSVKMNSYTVGDYDVYNTSANAYYSRYHGTEPKFDSNYIYLENGVDLRQQLYSKNSASDITFASSQGIKIKANLTLTYPNSDSIALQYPKREEAELNNNTKGTWIGCNASVASTESGTISSKMTKYINEETGETEEDPKELSLYYTRSSASAHLLYKSDDSDGKYSSGNYYDQLGINANDLPASATDNRSTMNTIAVYDISELLGIADNADGVELSISLYRKDSEGKYTIPLDLNDYITDLNFNTLTYSSDTRNSKLHYYRFSKSDLSGVYNGGVYTIPIDYKVKTAFSSEDRSTHYYSNYKVVVDACLYKTEIEEINGEENTSYVPVNGTNDDDHLIYTNAKISKNAFN